MEKAENKNFCTFLCAFLICSHYSSTRLMKLPHSYGEILQHRGNCRCHFFSYEQSCVPGDTRPPPLRSLLRVGKARGRPILRTKYGALPNQSFWPLAAVCTDAHNCLLAPWPCYGQRVATLTWPVFFTVNNKKIAPGNTL